MEEDCYTVITTINGYDRTSIGAHEKTGYHVIVVGDIKTPHDTYTTSDTMTYKIVRLQSDRGTLRYMGVGAGYVEK